MVLERDQVALDFIEKFRIVTSKQVSDIAYHNIDIANRRLRIMTQNRLLHRIYNPIGMGYIYSTKQIRTVKQLRHTLLRNEFHFKLLEMGCEIIEVDVEPIYGSVRPDAIYVVNYKGKRYGFLLEVEISNRVINTEKYNNWFLQEYKQYLKVPIPVVYITRKPVKRANYPYNRIEISLKDIENIFR